MLKNITDYNTVINYIKTFMILDENSTYIIDLILATAISLELDQPVWLMIIAPPSSGKTELLNILSQYPLFHQLYTITPKFLFSGHPMAQGGYMLRKVGKKGIIAFPDFTTVLSMNSKSRNEIFNQFRVMYDGKAGLGTGIDTGELKAWEGKVAVISLVTETIEKMKEKSSDLGERFLYFHYYPKDITETELKTFKSNSQLRNDIPNIIKDYINSKLSLMTKIMISDTMKYKIFSLAKFISISRAIVERDNYKREIINVYSPEQPHRVFNALKSLLISLIAVNDNDKRSFSILKQVAISTIPKLRYSILACLKSTKSDLISVNDILSSISKISDSKVRRTVEDMIAIDILEVVVHSSSTKKYLKFSVKFQKILYDISGK